MKDFSNETKRIRRNSVLKVVLKRYSFIVWVPLLLYISYYTGEIIILITQSSIFKNSYDPNPNIIITTILGLQTLLLLFLITFFIIAFIKDVIITSIKEKKFFSNIKSIGENLLYLIEEILRLLVSILKIPMYLYKIIKNEKKRFQNAVEEQISKDNNKN